MKHKTFFAILFSGVFLDQAAKYFVSRTLALGSGPAVIEGFFSITYIRNTGAAFGMFQGNNSFFIAFSLCFVSLLLFYVLYFFKGSRLSLAALAFIAAGAAGNLLDRVFRGYVVDFFDLRYFSVFNTADVMINIGVAALLFEILTGTKKRSS